MRTSHLAGAKHVAETGHAGLHLIDLENLLGTRRDAAGCAAVWAAYERQVGVRTSDQIVLSVDVSFAPVAWFALPLSARRVPAWGKDGADLALIDSLRPDTAPRRYGRVVIASGDHIFTSLAAGLRTAGVLVEQVVGIGRPSATLYAACNRSTRLALNP